MAIIGAYIIYSADVISDSSHFIERMSPAEHMPAGHNGKGRAERERIAAKFVQTESDEQYDFGYLAKEGSGPEYLPYEPGGDGPGQGQHRKWAAELTAGEWRIFADSYLIDLDPNGIPEDYEDTLGSITEYGVIPAVSVSNREGWEDASGSIVIDSCMYVSFEMDGPEPSL
jgi:hypothetical protein